jgi:hypothetical protein
MATVAVQGNSATKLPKQDKPKISARGAVQNFFRDISELSKELDGANRYLNPINSDEFVRDGGK